MKITNRYMSSYLEYISVVKGFSETSIEGYEVDLTLFFKYLTCVLKKERPLEELELASVEGIDLELLEKVDLDLLYSFMSYLKIERKNCVTTRKRKIATLKSFYNYMVNKRNLLKNNPAQELESPKAGKRLPVYLNEDESKRLLKSIHGQFEIRDRAIITLFLSCGLRISELTHLSLENYQDKKIRIVGKGNKERIISLNKACIEAIELYLKIRNETVCYDGDYLFLSNRHTRMNNRTIQYMLKKYLKAAQLNEKKYSPHKLRHTAATLLYSGTNDIISVKEILGHESLATTQLYAHIDETKRKATIDSNPIFD